jgi:hypothetical protein
LEDHDEQRHEERGPQEREAVPDDPGSRIS